jgi:alkylhydroperoxidase family enzyme
MSATALGHQPETLAAFQRLYGRLWRRGVLAAEIKETLRLRYGDAFLTHPVSIGESLRIAVLARFRDDEIVEMTAALAIFSGFSKIAIALGPIPDDLPIMPMPMPDLAE